jgi:hypothetical protein
MTLMYTDQSDKGIEGAPRPRVRTRPIAGPESPSFFESGPQMTLMYTDQSDKGIEGAPRQRVRTRPIAGLESPSFF